jgi:hypothetical protein
VNGIITASQALRRWAGVSSVALEPQPQTERDHHVNGNAGGHGRHPARRDHRNGVIEGDPQRGQQRDPQQGAPSLAGRTDLGVKGGGGHGRCSLRLLQFQY